MNLYTPERQADETQATYRHRRQQAKRAVNAMRCVGMSGGTSQREQMRNSRRSAGKLKGRYGADLMAHFADKNAAAQAARLAKLQRRAG